MSACALSLARRRAAQDGWLPLQLALRNGASIEVVAALLAAHPQAEAEVDSAEHRGMLVRAMAHGQSSATTAAVPASEAGDGPGSSTVRSEPTASDPYVRIVGSADAVATAKANMALAPQTPGSVSIWQRAVLAVKSLDSGRARGFGTCFVIDADRGLLWTCSQVAGQVVGQMRQIGMAAAPGQPVVWMYEARVEHSTPEQLWGGALLRITARMPAASGVLPLHPLTHADGKPLPALPLGDEAALSLPGAEPAILLGYPAITQVMTPTVGIYSNLKDYGAHGGVFLLTDATMLPGRSGGPGLNQRGEVVGWIVRHAMATAARPGGGHAELRPVSALLAELQGQAATAAFGAAAPADVRAHLASQPGCIAAGTHLFGPALSARRKSSPSHLGIVIDGDFPDFDEENFKRKLANYLQNEITAQDISIKPAVGRASRVVRVRTGSCEVHVSCNISGRADTSEEDEEDEADRITALLKQLIEKYWPREVQMSNARVIVSMSG